VFKWKSPYFLETKFTIIYKLYLDLDKIGQKVKKTNSQKIIVGYG
jgi:hypothetical protein